MPQWDADRIVTEAELADVIFELEGVRPVSIEQVAQGWDNTVFRVDDEWLFRVPRRLIAEEGVRLERRILPKLARRLPIAIPEPTRGCNGPPRAPWPVMGYRIVDGCEIAESPMNESLPAALGETLRILHGAELATELGPLLPGDRFSRARLDTRIAKAITELRQAAEAGLPVPADELCQRLAALAPAQRLPMRTAVTHGDLHQRHVLVTAAGALAGIIDWGDLHLGNPAMDLELCWSLFDDEQRAAFARAYGPVPAQEWAVALVVAVYTNLALLVSAGAQKVPHVAASATRALARIAAAAPPELA